MKSKNKIRRLVLRINPVYEEHVKLEKQIKSMCKTMGFTNTQAVLMLLNGFNIGSNYDFYDEGDVQRKTQTADAETDVKQLIESKNQETVKRLDDFVENEHKSIMEQTDNLLDSLSDL